jgi:hypothetical protein
MQFSVLGGLWGVAALRLQKSPPGKSAAGARREIYGSFSVVSISLFVGLAT